MTKKIAKYTALMAGIALLTLASPSLGADLPGHQRSAYQPSFPSVNSWYLRGDIGIGFSDTSGLNDEALSLGGGIGYRFSDMLRTDVTFDYAGEYNGGGVDADAYSVMLNSYIDFPGRLPAGITPYIGGGIGWGKIDASGAGAGSFDDDGFAFALMGGFSVPIMPKLKLDLGYKYREILVDGSNAQDHLVRAGLRWSLH